MGTPEPTKEWIRGYYAEATELYMANWAGDALAFHLGLDDGTCRTRNDALEASNAYLADRASIGPETKVLDAGCGVGGSALWLARHRGANVVGITIAPEQVVIAERLAKEAGLDHLTTFREMDFASTTFTGASFDVILNLESMCHAFDKPAYLRHVFDLLRSGGRFACLDMFTAPSGADESIVRAMCENWSLPSMPSVESVRQSLVAAGFEGIQSEDLTKRVLRPIDALRAMAMNARQMLKLEKAIHGSTSAVYEAHVQGALACAEGVAKGTFQYAYVGATKR